jgi:hypothetical protein
MALYDVPPSRIRKVEAFKCTKKLSLNSIENRSQEDNSQSSFGSGNTVISRKEEVGESESNLPLQLNTLKDETLFSLFLSNGKLLSLSPTSSFRDITVFPDPNELWELSSWLLFSILCRISVL